jgi:cytidylate kinase
VAYLDTGATYRTLAFAALEAKLNPITDAHRIAQLGHRLNVAVGPSANGAARVTLGDRDVSKLIRTEEVTEAAAQISQHTEVRAAMVRLQRRLAARHSVVVEGRDTGSVVFPKAAFKFYLDADPHVRARRRQLELKQMYGSKPPLAQVREQLHFRDGLDRSRRVGPLVKPRGAIAIDTTHRSAPQVVQAMLRHLPRPAGDRAAVGVVREAPSAAGRAAARRRAAA